MYFTVYKKIAAFILSVCVILSALVTGADAESPNDSSLITVIENNVILSLEFADTYYNLQNSGYDDANDYRGRS